MLIMTQVLVARPSTRPVAVSVSTQSRCAASLPSSWNHVSIWTTSPLRQAVRAVQAGRRRVGLAAGSRWHAAWRSCR